MLPKNHYVLRKKGWGMAMGRFLVGKTDEHSMAHVCACMRVYDIFVERLPVNMELPLA